MFDPDSMAEAIAAKVVGKILPELQKNSLSPRLLSVAQAAVYLGRSRHAIELMVAAKKLPAVRQDRRVFLDIRDLDDWIETHKEGAA
jgi:excisionase family DNA binding protein